MMRKKNNDHASKKEETSGASPPPRQRILEAAVSLFADQGFHGTSVREVASQAGVNVAMINYYYGSKEGLLQAILEQSASQLQQEVTSQLSPEIPLEESLERYLRAMIRMFRQDPQPLRVALSHLSLDLHNEALAEVKAQKVKENLFPAMMTLLNAPSLQEKKRSFPPWMGVIIQGMLLFHFLTTPLFSQLIDGPLDDEFYEEFVQHLLDLLLYGLLGTKAKPPHPDES